MPPIQVSCIYRCMSCLCHAPTTIQTRRARAITDLTTLRQLWLTQAVPGCLGLAAIGAHLHPLSPAADEVLALDLDPDGMANDVVTVLAPIAPGLIRPARVRAWRVLPVGE